MTNKLMSLIFLLLLATPRLAARAEATVESSSRGPTAAQLLASADRARGGFSEGLSWTIEIAVDDEGSVSTRSYLVRAKGNDALAEALSPAKNKGELMLFNDRALWFVKPGLRKPVALSTRQRLSGDAANGDIASTNYARDYEGHIVGEEQVDGEAAYKLELKARSNNVTYDNVHYWISKSRRLGLKAEFRTVSNAVFKVACFEYGNEVRYRGALQPFVSKMVIRDASGSKRVTTLAFRSPRVEAHATAIFNINNVMR